MLDIATVIWGKSIDLFLGGALPSVIQPGNIPAAKGLLHSYNFYASDEAKERITQNELYAELCQQIKVNWFPLQKGEWEITRNMLYQMKIGVEEGHYSLTVGPDIIVGNGSIFNIANLCNGKNNPILYGFPRVSDEGYEILTSLLKERKVLSNRELVSIAMRYIEQDCYPTEKKDNHWVVRHCTPTICLLPDNKILSICATCPNKYGGFDHSIPYTMITKGYPWYLVKHSDIYFQVERGEHLVSDNTSIPWNSDMIIPGVKFFDKQEQIWQGEEETNA